MAEEEKDYSESENTEEEQGDSSEEQPSLGADDQQSESKDYKTLYENQKIRAEKAEAKAKKVAEAANDEEGSQEGESQPPKKKDSQSLPESQMSAEELRIIARAGYDDDELDKLRKVAQVEDVSLSEAEKSDIFSSWYQRRQNEQKAEQAQMGGSHSSGRKGQDKDISDPGLSKKEHEELWKQTLSN